MSAEQQQQQQQPTRSASGDESADSAIPDEVRNASTEEVVQRCRMLENEIRVLKSEDQRLQHEAQALKERVKENEEKIKLNKQLPFLVGNVVEVLDTEREADDDDDGGGGGGGGGEENAHAEGAGQRRSGRQRTAREEEEGANVDLDAQRGGRAVVLKTSTRQTIYLPVPGLVDASSLRPSDLVGVNKDSYLILEKLPEEYDSRVKAFEVDEKPTEDFSDIGGLDKQIQEVIEAVVLPMTHKERFEKVGIKPPKGVLMYGPPGTGKTLLARACAAQTNATFLKLAATSLVQMYIGDGARLVRDAFALAKKKAPAIIFIDELDAIGTKRFDSDKSGDRETQRTMLELLNQLDGFDRSDDVSVLAASNRPDILDAALMRSGRLDRKIEFPEPDETARARILQIHSRKMNVHADVAYDELARSTEDFNAAMLKAVCVEAGMAALRADRKIVVHEDYVDGVAAVQAKKRTSLNYYA